MATLIVMPRLSPTMEEGVLLKWTKKEGDAIVPGDVIAEVETDKANMDFPLEDEGVLLKLLVKEGDTVKLGDPVAVLGVAGEDPAEALKSVGAHAAKPAAASTPRAALASPTAAEATVSAAPTARAPASAAPSGGNGQPTGRVKASPFARKLARDRGVDLQRVRGSGPHGRVIKQDILSAAGHGALQTTRPALATPPAEDQVVPASQMRKTIARRLIEAKREIPHIYLTAEATVDGLFDLREQRNELDAGVKISINDLVVKALALALRRMPDANVSWTDGGILRHGRVDVGVAVSLPDGLITPVVRSADQQPIAAISREIKSLAERARAKKLKPEEFSGGSATVTNLGMFGVREFSAIINPPESVILAVGTTEKRAVVITQGGHDTLSIARRMTLTLSCDHRVVDGVLGAQLLAEIVKLLERPLALVL